MAVQTEYWKSCTAPQNPLENTPNGWVWSGWCFQGKFKQLQFFLPKKIQKKIWILLPCFQAIWGQWGLAWGATPWLLMVVTKPTQLFTGLS